MFIILYIIENHHESLQLSSQAYTMPPKVTQWHKYFRNDFDNPPRLEKIYTCFLFSYVVLSQAVLQLLRKFFLQPKNKLIKDSQKLLPNY